MKKQIWILILVVVVIVVGVLIFSSQKTEQPQKAQEIEVVKIGAILPLTGTASPYGSQIRNGVDLAFQEINASNLVLKYEDSKCDPKEGISAYNKLVDIDKVKIIIGDFCSSVVLAIAPLAEEDHTLLITPGAAHKKISELGDYIFRNHVTISQKTRLLAQMASKKFKTAAILYDRSNDAFIDSMNTFKDIFSQEKGNQILLIESFSKEDTDFRSQLSKIKLSKPEAIYLGGLAAPLILVVKQIKELGIESQILTDDGTLDPSFLKALGNLGEDIIFDTTRFDKDIAPDFWASYYNSFGTDPTIFSAQGYDTLKIIYSIIKNKCIDGDSTCIKDEFYKIKDYPGVSGKTSFNEKGDAAKEVELKIIKNGQFVPYEE